MPFAQGGGEDHSGNAVWVLSVPWSLGGHDAGVGARNRCIAFSLGLEQDDRDITSRVLERLEAISVTISSSRSCLRHPARFVANGISCGWMDTSVHASMSIEIHGG